MMLSISAHWRACMRGTMKLSAEVLMAMSMKMAVFWVVVFCRLFYQTKW
jgi:hypothetical protein